MRQTQGANHGMQRASVQATAGRRAPGQLLIQASFNDNGCVSCESKAPRGQARMKLQFKFREASPDTVRGHVIAQLNQQGARQVRRMFPDETDEELSSLWVVDYEDQTAGWRLLQLLSRSEAVDFAEGETRRRPVA